MRIKKLYVMRHPIRKIIPLCIIILFATSCAKEEYTNKLAGTWEFKELSNNTETVYPSDKYQSTVTFNTNNTFTDIEVRNGETSKAEGEYLLTEPILFLSYDGENEETNLRVVELTETSLKLRFTTNGEKRISSFTRQ